MTDETLIPYWKAQAILECSHTTLYNYIKRGSVIKVPTLDGPRVTLSSVLQAAAS